MRRRPLTTALVAPLMLWSAAAATAAPPKGDFELTGPSGAVGSFAVAGAGHRLVVRDLVVQAPISCRNAPVSPLPIDVEVISATVPLTADGTFTTGAIKRTGSGTAVSARFRRGRFSLTYRHVSRVRNLYEGGLSVCDTRTLHLTAKRGHRRALKEGIWTGQSTQQEPVQLSVVAGGRALEPLAGPGPGGAREYAFGLAPSSGNDPCSYDVGFPVFVAHDGTFSNAGTHRGDEAVLSGRFTRATAISGQFENLAEGCGQESWSARWSFSPKTSG